MKKNVITALTVVFALCLALTVYAMNQTNVSPKNTAAAAADCCAKKDSCRMKDKKKSAEKASCCDKDDCCRKGESCCKGDSCPMKANGEKTAEGSECCCKGGDSCPMKKDADKQTARVGLKNFTVAAHAVN